MMAIFGDAIAPRRWVLKPDVFHGVYSRLKQFILDIYNGNVAYNADHLSGGQQK